MDHPETGLLAILLRPLETRLKLPQGYLMSLGLEPSDWVFIVKLGLLVEAALTEYLVLEIGRAETYEHVSGLDQSKRLKLAGVLGLLTKGDRSMLQMLSEVRNEFAHRIENLQRPLSVYISELSQRRRNQIAAVLLLPEVLKESKSSEGFDAAFATNFRSILLNTVVLPLITISAKHNSQLVAQERAKWQAEQPRIGHFAFRPPGQTSDLEIGPAPSGAPGPGIPKFNVPTSPSGQALSAPSSENAP